MALEMPGRSFMVVPELSPEILCRPACNRLITHTTVLLRAIHRLLETSQACVSIACAFILGYVQVLLRHSTMLRSLQTWRRCTVQGYWRRNRTMAQFLNVVWCDLLTCRAVNTQDAQPCMCLSIFKLFAQQIPHPQRQATRACPVVVMHYHVVGSWVQTFSLSVRLIYAQGHVLFCVFLGFCGSHM